MIARMSDSLIVIALFLSICIHFYPTWALNPIMVRGNKLFDSVTKERFYLKGITYGFETEVNYENYWKSAMETIRGVSSQINTVRLYHINPPIHASQYTKRPWCNCGNGCSQDPTTIQFGGFCTSNGDCKYLNASERYPGSPWCCYSCDTHENNNFDVSTNYDTFMQEALRLGLYVVVPLTPVGDPPWEFCSLQREGRPEESASVTCYPSCLLSYAMSVMNAFGKYANTLTYVIGNEVFFTPETFPSARCIKAFNRDVKSYMMNCDSQRLIPTLYAAADRALWPLDASETNRIKMEYLNCGPWHLRVDIFGLNVYRWCGASVPYSVAYAAMVNSLKEASCPLVLSEYGCPYSNRNWRQLEVLYGWEMADGWSGGTAYSYGVSGGLEYAMFWNWNAGEKWPTQNPGTSKYCSDNGVCNVDMFTEQLGWQAPNVAKTHLLGSDYCTLKPAAGVHSHNRKSCPDYDGSKMPEYEFRPEYGTNLPRSRWFAAGWVGVNCPAGTISAVDQKEKDCYRPIHSGHPCAFGGWCTECNMKIDAPDYPHCTDSMVWLSSNWQSITFQGQLLDGSICGFQQYLHVHDGVCPPPDDTFICQNNQCIRNPTPAPTTSAPTPAPTPAPTIAPTLTPIPAPTLAPTTAPTTAPTQAPTSSPTQAPTFIHTSNPIRNTTTTPYESETIEQTTLIIILSAGISFPLVICLGFFFCKRKYNSPQRPDLPSLMPSGSIQVDKVESDTNYTLLGEPKEGSKQII